MTSSSWQMARHFIAGQDRGERSGRTNPSAVKNHYTPAGPDWFDHPSGALANREFG